MLTHTQTQADSAMQRTLTVFVFSRARFVLDETEAALEDAVIVSQCLQEIEEIDKKEKRKINRQPQSLIYAKNRLRMRSTRNSCGNVMNLMMDEVMARFSPDRHSPRWRYQPRGEWAAAHLSKWRSGLVGSSRAERRALPATRSPAANGTVPPARSALLQQQQYDYYLLSSEECSRLGLGGREREGRNHDNRH